MAVLRGQVMKSETKKQSCKYCQILLVDAQQSSTLTTPLALRKKHSQTKVMKCPVCGYSELRALEFQDNHSEKTSHLTIDRQTHFS